jgi:hypothetical protein
VANGAGRYVNEKPIGKLISADVPKKEKSDGLDLAKEENLRLTEQNIKKRIISRLEELYEKDDDYENIVVKVNYDKNDNRYVAQVICPLCPLPKPVKLSLLRRGESSHWAISNFTSHIRDHVDRVEGRTSTTKSKPVKRKLSDQKTLDNWVKNKRLESADVQENSEDVL